MVSWAGKPLGTIKLGDVKVVGDVGGVIDTESAFQVGDVAHLTEFTKVRYFTNPPRFPLMIY